VTHGHRGQIIARDCSCEDRSPRRLSLDHANFDGVDLGKALEHPLNGGEGVMATLLDEQFVASAGW
jgi:hypothetical protein